jgi:hypothetical protein
MSYQLIMTIPVDQEMIDDAKDEFPDVNEHDALHMMLEKMRKSLAEEFGNNASAQLKEVG